MRSDEPQPTRAPRLSKPLELMSEAYDCVVIGSGYGGGIAASRMARAGQSVCILERGQERWPGEYPSGLDALDQLHVSGHFAPGETKGKLVEGGDPTGMYHLIFGKGQNAFVCNGLGGTSLINANVFMEANKETLDMENWPVEINSAQLEKYYRKARDVLEPQCYPSDWPTLPKLKLLQKQAQAIGLGDRFRRVKQTTRFHNGPNSCGVEMSASTLTGQDCTGINDGSKTTTLVTYLADAWNWGADIFCECEVRHIEKAMDQNGKERPGYIVCFAWHGRKRGQFKDNLYNDLLWVYARNAVFLGAGAIGSTEILLRSKSVGLDMSDAVGTNMSGNGDILAFGYNTKEYTNSIGNPHPSRSSPIGPTINGVIDCRSGHDNPLDGFVIEEGALPHALSAVFQAMLDLMPDKIPPQNQSLHDRTKAALARYGSRFLGPYYKNGALKRTQIYLIMSHDSNQAVLTLQDDKPVLEFIGVGRSEHVKQLNDILAKATQAVGGTFVQSPFYALLGEQEITVHPIGGACMARDHTGKTGVVNHECELLKGTGTETWDGLVVMDGAVIPAALGANPFATISALAERAVERYAFRKGLVISEEKNGVLDLFGEPAHRPATFLQLTGLLEAQGIIRKADMEKANGITFNELLSGFIHPDPRLIADDQETYKRASRRAESLCQGARVFLTVDAFNTNLFVKSSTNRAMVTGTVTCALPGSPFSVQRGEYDLFSVDDDLAGTRTLTYDFEMVGVDGRRLHFHGYKAVDSSVAFHPSQFWRSATTLYVTISEPDVRVGSGAPIDAQHRWRLRKPIAKGILRVQPGTVVSGIKPLAVTGVAGLLTNFASLSTFANFVLKRTLTPFLTPFAPLQYPTQTYPAFVNNTPPSQSIAIEAQDGVRTTMHVWEPTYVPDSDSNNIRNLLMIPDASVDHQIFALPTIPFNAVNYFCRAGYRVFVSVHRLGKAPAEAKDWTTYDARLDLKAAIGYIREHFGIASVYAIAQGMGSVALSSKYSCIQSRRSPTPSGPGFPLSPTTMLYRSNSWFNFATSPNDTFLQRALNQLLRLSPDSRGELCDSATCHRVSLIFGRCWNHHNLNAATHSQLDRFFGGISIALDRFMKKQGAAGYAMSNGPEYNDLTVPENVERLRGIPVLLWVGSDNAVMSHRATEKTYEVLCDAFGGEQTMYRRRVVPGYGHMDGWVGTRAYQDVYPFIREEVDRVVRGPAYKFVEPEDKWKRMVESGEIG
ncbi:FAD/NAD(P)-binding domain-containing protein [Mycena kentingensis (nom. inval.)]|nr:FAD/NAD(P)-binding domain-containing protein [Mycena kentingensis (nom. inval.)]